MKITFLGTGEAFDDNLPNNSHLLVSEKIKLLVDCGYSVPQQWFKFKKEADFLDAIYISHKHADHFFGLPIILMRMWEEGRTKPISIICQEESVEFLKSFMELAYKGFVEKFKYKINFIGVKSGRVIELRDLKLSFAPTVHSIENLAIRITNGENSYCYSGDGQFVKETIELYKNSDLVIQETYLYDENKIGHSCIKDSIKMAEQNNIKCLALTHINRDFRKNNLEKIRYNIKSEKVKIIIPEPLDEHNF
ncbi:MAG: ribonuclease Z [Candidatus Staskawiczbacteria bacterium]|nr:ribonuclease Z [Candidatus Staskawiczbacteria bacterium]